MFNILGKISRITSTQIKRKIIVSSILPFRKTVNSDYDSLSYGTMYLSFIGGYKLS